MLAEIDSVLTHYESGSISRRELVAALFAMAVPTNLKSQNAPLVVTATQLNHATLMVRDVGRSQAFYQGQARSWRSGSWQRNSGAPHINARETKPGNDEGR